MNTLNEAKKPNKEQVKKILFLYNKNIESALSHRHYVARDVFLTNFREIRKIVDTYETLLSELRLQEDKGGVTSQAIEDKRRFETERNIYGVLAKDLVEMVIAKISGKNRWKKIIEKLDKEFKNELFSVDEIRKCSLEYYDHTVGGDGVNRQRLYTLIEGIDKLNNFDRLKVKGFDKEDYKKMFDYWRSINDKNYELERENDRWFTENNNPDIFNQFQTMVSEKAASYLQQQQSKEAA